MNNYNEQGYVYPDMTSLMNVTFPNNNFQNIENYTRPGSGAGQNQSMTLPANLYDNQEGFIKGNLFANLYNQYKNYRPMPLNATNEQERLYLNLSSLSFAAHELNLYLDNYPNDAQMIKLFNTYQQLAEKAMKEYEAKYGPLSMASNALNSYPWAWTQTKFPWDEGGM